MMTTSWTFRRKKLALLGLPESSRYAISRRLGRGEWWTWLMTLFPRLELVEDAPAVGADPKTASAMRLRWTRVLALMLVGETFIIQHWMTTWAWREHLVSGSEISPRLKNPCASDDWAIKREMNSHMPLVFKTYTGCMRKLYRTRCPVYAGGKGALQLFQVIVVLVHAQAFGKEELSTKVMAKNVTGPTLIMGIFRLHSATSIGPLERESRLPICIRHISSY